MARRVDITSYAAIPAILAIAGAAFVMKPEEMRRNPVLEVQGFVGMTPQYEVMYAGCLPDAGLRGFNHRFPARDDGDAARFVTASRPSCDVASLYRLDRSEGNQQTARYRRTRIEI